MNEAIMRAAGFGAEVDRVRNGRCAWCNVVPAGFRDELSLREYRISGLCQQCQDGIFGKEGQ